jgi:hypothetical protein
MDFDRLIEKKTKFNFKLLLGVLVVLLLCFVSLWYFSSHLFDSKIVKMNSIEATDCFINYVFPDTSILNVKIIGGERCINFLNEGISLYFYADQISIDKIMLFQNTHEINGEVIRPLCHSVSLTEVKEKNKFGLKYIAFACISG